MDWAFLHFIYFVFLHATISTSILASSLFTFGLSSIAWILYELIILFGGVLLNLFLTNRVYEGFHPILAPELVGLEGMQEIMDQVKAKNENKKLEALD